MRSLLRPAALANSIRTAFLFPSARPISFTPTAFFPRVQRAAPPSTREPSPSTVLLDEHPEEYEEGEEYEPPTPKLNKAEKRLERQQDLMRAGFFGKGAASKESFERGLMNKPTADQSLKKPKKRKEKFSENHLFVRYVPSHVTNERLKEEIEAKGVPVHNVRLMVYPRTDGRFISRGYGWVSLKNERDVRRAPFLDQMEIDEIPINVEVMKQRFSGSFDRPPKPIAEPEPGFYLRHPRKSHTAYLDRLSSPELIGAPEEGEEAEGMMPTAENYVFDPSRPSYENIPYEDVRDRQPSASSLAKKLKADGPRPGEREIDWFARSGAADVGDYGLLGEARQRQLLIDAKEKAEGDEKGGMN